jgi:hypothetical protein
MSYENESIAGVERDGSVVTDWVPATRTGVLGVLGRATLTVHKECQVHAIVCTDGSRVQLKRPYNLQAGSEIRFGMGVGEV